jgi:hypothetical protein
MIGVYDRITFVSDLINFVFVAGVFFLTYKYTYAFISKFPSLKGFYYTILISLGIAFVGNLVDVLDNLMVNGHRIGGQFTDQLTSWIYAITIALIGIAWVKMLVSIIEKYNPVPVVRENLRDEKSITLNPGLYICLNSEKCYQYFKRLLAVNPGLVVSRNPPEAIREALGLRETPVLWLTKVEKKETVYPTNLPYLLQTLIDFMKREDKPKVLLLDGAEYLVLENSFKAVFKFLATLKDYAILTHSIILVPIEEEAYEKRELSFILREFYILD